MARRIRPELAPGTIVRIRRSRYEILGTDTSTTRAGSRIYRVRIIGTEREVFVSEASVTVED
jgi:hypothetical protein